MEYQPGAAICNLLLADEINRASSRTQSALLEAMEEGSVTVDGVTHLIPQPFTVIATQNPTGSAGTQLLPDSQLDRFMMRLSIGYPEPAAEREMLRRKHGENHGQAVPEGGGCSGLAYNADEVSKVFVHEELYDYIVRLARATREHKSIRQGASPRCSVAAMALAPGLFLDGWAGLCGAGGCPSNLPGLHSAPLAINSAGKGPGRAAARAAG